VTEGREKKRGREITKSHKMSYHHYASKFQIFFVLRKKDSQVTFLHLYHHSLTPLETWICVKFIAGGHGTLGNLINNAVHVIMYAYYMLAAMGPEYQKYLWWKKHLTTVQLVSEPDLSDHSYFYLNLTSIWDLTTCLSHSLMSQDWKIL